MIKSLRKLWRSAPFAFRAGLAVGGIISAYPLMTAIVMAGPDMVAKYPLELSFAGADLSRRGVSEAVIADSATNIAQVCRDVCDDVVVKFRAWPGEKGPSVTLYGAADRRVIHREDEIYVDQGWATRYAYDEHVFQRVRRDVHPNPGS